MITLPANVIETMKTLTDGGFAVYAVGGSVRDALMGIVPKDWDLATDARLCNLEGLFPDAKVISEKYSIIRRDFVDAANGENLADSWEQPASHIDIATLRKEGAYGDSRRPDWVAFVDKIEEDVKRRDFTINAIAVDAAGEIVDPLDGIRDLSDKTIRCVGNPTKRFMENPIRMLRAARMASEYGFWPDEKTFAAMAELGGTLKKAGPDRIRADFIRLMDGRFPSRGMRLLVDANMLGPVCGIPEEEIPQVSRKALSELIQRIDAAPDDAEHRLGLFYGCLGEELGRTALMNLNFDRKTRKRLESNLRPETEETC